MVVGISTKLDAHIRQPKLAIFRGVSVRFWPNQTFFLLDSVTGRIMQFQNIGFGQQIIIFFSASFFFKYDSAKINMRFGQKNFVFTTLLEKTGKQKNKI